MHDDELGRAVEHRSGLHAWISDPAEFPSLVPPLPFEHDVPPPSSLPSDFPELDCIRGRIADTVIAAAQVRSAELGVSADRVLIASGAITEEAYVRAFAESCGTAFEALDQTARAACPLPDERLIEAVSAGILPLRQDGDLVFVIAPRGTATRCLTRFFASGGYARERIRFTSAAQLQQFVARHGDAVLARWAVDGLNAACPALSAAPRPGRPAWMIGTIMLCLIGLLVAVPHELWASIHVLVSVFFVAWILLRLFGSLVPHPEPRHAARLADRGLPVYTVVAALYREAKSVPQLVGALRQLDYPAEKLDIKLVVEPDDIETRAAIERLHLGPPFEIITAPDAGPRTKPKALNAALPFARGAFAVVYDAEDRPEPDQLRRALGMFLADKNLACVQARLTIDNTADSWLARLFTAEYAGQFDVFLPGLATLGLPLPLGGSSNHFRTSVLRKVGGWDPYNVTEDADLGMRLSRFAFASTVIASTTYEEAPARFMPWLRQRTRWFKGWMQTWLVHMRTPRLTLADLGPAGFASFQLVVGGNVLAALVYPLFLAGALWDIARDAPPGEGLGQALLTGLHGTTLALGFLGAGIVGWLGLMRRGLAGTAWVLVLIPLHWMLLSLAAWRALYQLLRDPYRWEKTEHGVAQTSRRPLVARMIPVFPKRRTRRLLATPRPLRVPA
jgi:hypothetical protein